MGKWILRLLTRLPSEKDHNSSNTWLNIMLPDHAEKPAPAIDDRGEDFIANISL